MHMLIADETNKEPNQGPFFVVGGLVLDVEQIADIDQAVRNRAENAGFKPGDRFKFNSNDRPKHISNEQHTAAKAGLMHDLADIGVKMMVTVCLHDIDKNSDYNQKMNYSLNTLAWGFYKFLSAEGVSGLMVMDRDNERYGHLENLFQNGLSFTDGGNQRLNDRIRFFGMTSDNASGLSSATDIALGSFRYCANAAFDGGNQGRAEQVARQMMPTIAKLLWKGSSSNGNEVFTGYGFIPRPKIEDVYSQTLRDMYITLVTRLSGFSSVVQLPQK